jgi:hypothetical protein
MKTLINNFKQWAFLNKGSYLYLCLFWLLISTPISVSAQVNFPTQLQYNIEIQDSAAGIPVPLSGTYNMAVFLRSAGVTQNWTETLPSQYFNRGFTSVELGNNTPIIPDDFLISSPNFRFVIKDNSIPITLNSVLYTFRAFRTDEIISPLDKYISFESIVSFNGGISGLVPPFVVSSDVVVSSLNATFVDTLSGEFMKEAARFTSGNFNEDRVVGSYDFITLLGEQVAVTLNNSLIVNNDLVFVDDSFAGVGINTSNPGFTLDVGGTLNASFISGNAWGITRLNIDEFDDLDDILTASAILDTKITSSKIIEGAVLNRHVLTPNVSELYEKAIHFAKLFITKRDIVEDLIIPTEDTNLSTDDVKAILSDTYALVSGNNFLDVISSSDALVNLDISPADDVIFEGLVLTEQLVGIVASMDGTISANLFYGDAYGLHHLTIDGTSLNNVTAFALEDNTVTASHIVTASVFNEHINTPDFLVDGIVWKKLWITKTNLVVSLNIPTEDTHASTQSVEAMFVDNLLSSVNNLSEVVSTLDAWLNIGLGPTDTVTFNTLELVGNGLGPHLFVKGPSAVVSINGLVTANSFSGDGFALFNLDGASITNVVAGSVTDDSVVSESILTAAIRDHHINANADISFSKLVVLKENIVDLGIPTANRTTDNIVNLLIGQFQTPVSNLSLISSSLNARQNIGLSQLDTLELNSLVLQGGDPITFPGSLLSAHVFGLGPNFVASFNGKVSADVFAGDASNLDMLITSAELSDEQISGIIAFAVTPDVVYSSSIVNHEIMSEDISTYSILTEWPESGGSWVPNQDNKYVEISSGSHLPLLKFSDVDYRDTVLKGEFGSYVPNDNFFGLVFGLEQPLDFPSSHKYFLLDWEGPHSGGVPSSQLRLSYVSASSPFTVNLFTGNNLEVIATINSSYKGGRTYTYEIDYNRDNIRIVIDGNGNDVDVVNKEVFNVSLDFVNSKLSSEFDEFPTGRFGFMNFGQAYSFYTFYQGIDFKKLNIVKSDIQNLNTLGIDVAPIPLEVMPSTQVFNVLATEYLVTSNNLSNMQSSLNARENVGLGLLSNSTLNTLVLTGSTAPQLVVDSMSSTVVMNGPVSANTFSGDGSLITNINPNELSFVFGNGVEPGGVESEDIVDGELLAADFSAGAGIDFSKLVITKTQIVELGIPTANRTTTNIINMLLSDNHFLASANGFSEITSTIDAWNNIGLGGNDDVTFDTLTINTTSLTGFPNIFLKGPNAIASINGLVTANSLSGDGFDLVNLTGFDVDNVIAWFVDDASIVSDDISDESLINFHINSAASIEFSKLNILKSDIVNIEGIPGNIPTSNRSLENLSTMLATDYVPAVGSFSILDDLPAARDFMGLDEEDTLSVNALVLTGQSFLDISGPGRHLLASTNGTEFEIQGHVSANAYYIQDASNISISTNFDLLTASQQLLIVAETVSDNAVDTGDFVSGEILNEDIDPYRQYYNWVDFPAADPEVLLSTASVSVLSDSNSIKMVFSSENVRDTVLGADIIYGKNSTGYFGVSFGLQEPLTGDNHTYFLIDYKPEDGDFRLSYVDALTASGVDPSLGTAMTVLGTYDGLPPSGWGTDDTTSINITVYYNLEEIKVIVDDLEIISLDRYQINSILSKSWSVLPAGRYGFWNYGYNISHYFANARIESSKIDFASPSVENVKSQVVNMGIISANRDVDNLIAITTSNYLNPLKNLYDYVTFPDRLSGSLESLGLSENSTVTINSLTFRSVTPSELLVYGDAEINTIITANAFIGDGFGLYNLDGSEFTDVLADNVADNSVTSGIIIDFEIVSGDISDTAAISFSKLAISKSDLVDSLGLPTSTITQQMVRDMAAGNFLEPDNDLSDITSSSDAQRNIGFGSINDVTFNNLSLLGNRLTMLDGSTVVSLNGTVTTNFLIGGGFNIFNIPESSVNHPITAFELADGIVDSSHVVDGSLLGENFNTNAAIHWDKLDISYEQIVSKGVPSNNRTIGNIYTIVEEAYFVPANNLSEVSGFPYASQVSLGVGPDDDLEFKDTYILGDSLKALSTESFVASFNGIVTANNFQGDGTFLTGLSIPTFNGSAYNLSWYPDLPETGITASRVVIGEVYDSGSQLHVNGNMSASAFIGDGSNLKYINSTDHWLYEESNIEYQGYHYSGATDTIFIQSGVSSVTVKAWGAGGGGGISDGGGGAFSETTFPVIEGDAIQIVVGGPGGAGKNSGYYYNLIPGDKFDSNNGGFNGGGSGGPLIFDRSETFSVGAGGGGSSQVFRGGVLKSQAGGGAGASSGVGSGENIPNNKGGGLGAGEAGTNNTYSSFNGVTGTVGGGGGGSARNTSNSASVIAQGGDTIGDVQTAGNATNRFPGNTSDSEFPGSEYASGGSSYSDGKPGFISIGISRPDISSDIYTAKSIGVGANPSINYLLAANADSKFNGDLDMEATDIDISISGNFPTLNINSNSNFSDTTGSLLTFDRNGQHDRSGLLIINDIDGGTDEGWQIGSMRNLGKSMAFSFLENWQDFPEIAQKEKVKLFFRESASGVNQVSVGSLSDAALTILDDAEDYKFLVFGETFVSGNVIVEGSILPSVGSIFDIGVTDNRFNTLHYSTITNISDSRSKRNVRPLGYGLNSIKALKPVSFDWKSGYSSGPQIGLIAQSVDKVIPEVVSGSDSDGYGLYYNQLTAVLVKAYQEQQLEIEKRAVVLRNIQTKIVLLEEKWRRIKEENFRLRKKKGR